MKKRIMTLWLLLMMAALAPTAYGQIIMGSSSNAVLDDDTPTDFFDPGGTGPFGMNLRDTMTLTTTVGNSVLYALFEEFAMTEHDTLWIFNGENCNAPLMGIYHLVSSPGELVASGNSMTFVFHSDNEEIPGLNEGWKATVYAYDTVPDVVRFGIGAETKVTCLAEFYDSGGPNSNIANNNENQNGNTHTEFISPVGTHIKCVFDQFSINGRLEIYDGQFYDPNKRLIGQFHSSTLDPSTNRPPVLFSSGNTLTFVYVGAGGDTQKSGWKANISCVPELFESPDGSACPSITNVPLGSYEDVPNTHDILFDCSKPIILLDAEVVAPGPYTNDYTVRQIPYDPPFLFTAGTSCNASSDDSWLAPVTLPFTFSFFGKNYNIVYPGTNAIISLTPRSGSCNWTYGIPPASPPYTTISGNQTQGHPYNYENAIYGVYHDVHCAHYSNNGAVRRDVLGSYPCRSFVFNYDHIALYGHNSGSGSTPNEADNGYYNTYQMVLYEGTNIIDVYVKHCSKGQTATNSSASGTEGVIGLHNSTSSQLVIAPGRDIGWWVDPGNPANENIKKNQANEEAWRFTPITPLDENATLTWYEGSVSPANVIASGSYAAARKITVSPQETTYYISEYVFTNATDTSFTLYDTTLVRVNIPSITVTCSNGNTPICPGDASQLTVTTGTEYPNIHPQSYLWSTEDTTATCTVNPTQTKTYAVTVTFENQCTRNDTVKVLVTNLQLPEITGTDTICKGKSATLTVTHPSSNDFQWSNGQTDPTITVSPQVTTDYIVSATMIGNCIVTDTFTVTVLPLPEPAFQPSPTQIYVENGIGTVTCTNLTPGDNHLHWNFGDVFSNVNEVDDIENPSHDYTRAGYYTITLTATDQTGCVDSIKNRVTVEVPYFFYIPNSFTPDGDGLNEYFAPQGQGVDPDSYSMQIFDRSGMLIFSTRNPFDYWDGRNKYGQICPEGVYVYIIRLRNQNFEDKEYTGSVTLIK